MAIAQRLAQVIEAINSGHMLSESIDAPYIAEHICHDDDFDRVEQYLNGTSDQSFTFLNKFAEYFKVDQKWLKSGKGVPFPMRRASSPLGCLQMIEETKPKAIYFALDTSERKRAVLILEISDYAYMTIGCDDWPLALRNSTGEANVGCGGRHNILEFYSLVEKVYAFRDQKKFSQEQNQSLNICDIIISKQDMNKLIKGDINPKLIIYKNGLPSNSFWADDLRDLDWKWCGGREQYKKRHGNWFIETQEFIKREYYYTTD